RCPARRLPQARPAHRDDHAGDGRRHAADRARLRRGPLVPRPDGDRRHRRPGHLDRAQPAGDPRALHLRRRPRQPLPPHPPAHPPPPHPPPPLAAASPAPPPPRPAGTPPSTPHPAPPPPP